MAHPESRLVRVDSDVWDLLERERLPEETRRALLRRLLGLPPLFVKRGRPPKANKKRRGKAAQEPNNTEGNGK